MYSGLSTRPISVHSWSVAVLLFPCMLTEMSNIEKVQRRHMSRPETPQDQTPSYASGAAPVSHALPTTTREFHLSVEESSWRHRARFSFWVLTSLRTRGHRLTRLKQNSTDLPLGYRLPRTAIWIQKSLPESASEENEWFQTTHWWAFHGDIATSWRLDGALLEMLMHQSTMVGLSKWSVPPPPNN